LGARINELENSSAVITPSGIATLNGTVLMFVEPAPHRLENSCA
jgi:hypothetical protein